VNELDFCMRISELVIMEKSLIFMLGFFLKSFEFLCDFVCSFINDTAENTQDLVEFEFPHIFTFLLASLLSDRV